MKTFSIKQGRNLKITGSAAKDIIDIALPKTVGIQPQDFVGLSARLSVKVGDEVKVGSSIITDKVIEGLKLVSPVSGKVVAINRGDKRALREVVIETNENQESEALSVSQDVRKSLLDGGLWPVIRQRPFSKIANPADKPKSIFIRAMNTDPLALDVDVALEGKEEDFQAGIEVIKQLTDGKVNLCIDENAKSRTLTEAKNVDIYRFSGPHPAGNVSTHIHCVDPINKGDIVWYIDAQDVLRIAFLFKNEAYSSERIIAITGEGAAKKTYAKTIVGVPLADLLEGSNLSNQRCISGSILTGKDVGEQGYLSFYDTQITVIPEGGKREFLGWLMPGINNYTLSNTYASAFLPKNEYSLDTDEHGGHRSIVLNHIYDSLVPLDIMVYFLLKAIISEDIEEAEKLGILECDQEDFALCTFSCPSKTDIGAIIRDGLEIIEKEG